MADESIQISRKLESMVAQDKTQEAMEMLKNLLMEDLPSRYGNQIIHLQGQAEAIQKARINNVSSDEDISRSLNRISASFLELLNDLRKELESYLQFYNSIPVQEDKKQNLADYLQSCVSGRYELGKVISEGSTVIIFKAREVFANREVAIKVLKQSDIDKKAVLEEVKRLAKLKHRGITRIFDTYFEKYPYFVVTEFVNGMNLKKMMERSGHFSYYMTMEIMRELCELLEYARRWDVLYPVIRPSKVILDEEGYPMISPFSVLRNKQREISLEKMMEECRYLSPELLATDLWADDFKEISQADQFSLGLLAYELVTGVPLFKSNNLPDLLVERASFFKKPSIKKYLPEQLYTAETRPFWDIVQKMLQQDPLHRFSDLYQVSKALLALKPSRTNLHEITLASYNRCLVAADKQSKDFVDAFYENFFTAAPEARHLFSADWDRQRNMFRSSVRMFLESNSHNSTVKKLVDIPKHKGLDLAQYKVFLDELLHTIATYDPLYQSNTDIEKAWCTIQLNLLDNIATNLTHHAENPYP